MSRINMNLYARTLNDIATMKRNFKNSFQEEFLSLDVSNTDNDHDFVSVNYHLTTTNIHDDMNSKVEVSSRLLNDDTFTLSIDSKDDDGRNVHFTLFMNEDVRKEIVNTLENTIVNNREEE
jgi:hypothetical protein